MNKIVLITGATSGIGYATAEKFASHDFNLIITGRREEKLNQLKKHLEETYKVQVHTCCFDIQKKQEVQKAINELTKEWKQIDILVNNAGLALGRDSFEKASIEDWETMMQTNVNGLLYMSKSIVSLMIERKCGHVINIGSIAGKEVYENGNAYCASKFAVDAISKSMRIDLLKHHIKVTAIHPGAVETAFSTVRFKGDKTKAAAAYQGFTPLQAVDIANAIYFVAHLPSHVCINEMTITCTQQANATSFFKEM